MPAGPLFKQYSDKFAVLLTQNTRYENEVLHLQAGTRDYELVLQAHPWYYGAALNLYGNLTLEPIVTEIQLELYFVKIRQILNFLRATAVGSSFG